MLGIAGRKGDYFLKFENVSFGQIEIDGKVFTSDVVITSGEILPRDSSPSKGVLPGHTALTVEEDIPWECEKLYVGTGMYGNLPIQEDVRRAAREKSIELVTATTPEIAERLNEEYSDSTNVILHLTC